MDERLKDPEFLQKVLEEQRAHIASEEGQKTIKASGEWLLKRNEELRIQKEQREAEDWAWRNSPCYGTDIYSA